MKIPVLLLLLFGGVAQAAGPVVRVSNDRMQGGGVYLGDRLVLTSDHLTRSGTLAVTFEREPGKLSVAAQRIARDPDWDQSLLLLARDPQVKPVEIATRNPAVGNRVQVLRLGEQSKTGIVSGFVSSTTNEDVHDWAVIDTPLSEGWSGCPVLNAEGQLLGVAWGRSASTRRSAFVSTARTRLFLNEHLDRFQLTQRRVCPPGMLCQPRTTIVTPRRVYQAGGGRARPSPVPVVRPATSPATTAPATTSPATTAPSTQASTQCQQCQQKVEQNAETIAAVQSRLDELAARVDANETTLADHDDLLQLHADHLGKHADRLDALEDSTAGLQSQIETVKSQLHSLQTQMGTLTQQVEATVQIVENLEVGDGHDHSGIEERLAAIEARLDDLEAEPDEPSDPSGDSSLENLVLYYTSRAAPDVKVVDEKINELKRKGYPIVVTYLSPREAELKGVPQIFMPYSGKKVVGISNCLFFLAQLLPR